MTPNDLVDRLIATIQPMVAEFVLQTNVQGAPHRAPQVIGGFLGDKKPAAQQNPPDFPYVIVRYIEDDDTDEGNLAQVKIITGTYSEDAQNGWRDALNVANRIKTELMKRHIICPFSVEKPIKRHLPEEQPFPEWVAILTLTVQMPQVQAEGVWD